MSERPTRPAPVGLTAPQVWALALLFGLLSGVSLVRYLGDGGGRPGAPELTESRPPALVFPEDPFRAADAPRRGAGSGPP